jgi:hypothetical protein
MLILESINLKQRYAIFLAITQRLRLEFVSL